MRTKRFSINGLTAPYVPLLGRIATLCLIGLNHPSLVAQSLGPNPELLDFDRPEAWALKRFVALTQPDGFGPKSDLGPREWAVKGELSEVPFLSVDERRVGFGGGKVEDLNKAELVVRLYGQLGLPGRFSLELSYVPPIDVYDVEAQIASVGLARKIGNLAGVRIDGSVFYAYGEAEGAFTCSHDLVEAGEDPFDCVPPSHDRSLWRSAGAELVFSRSFETLALTPFVSSTYQYANSDFQVDALVSGGSFADQRTLKTDGYFWTFSAGAQWQVADQWVATVAFRYAPLDIRPNDSSEIETRSVNQIRSQLSYRF